MNILLQSEPFQEQISGTNKDIGTFIAFKVDDNGVEKFARIFESLVIKNQIDWSRLRDYIPMYHDKYFNTNDNTNDNDNDNITNKTNIMNSKVTQHAPLEKTKINDFTVNSSIENQTCLKATVELTKTLLETKPNLEFNKEEVGKLYKYFQSLLRNTENKTYTEEDLPF